LSWANGRVPTPYGPIEVKWEKQGSLMLNGHSVKTAATAFSTEGNTGRTGYTYVRDLAPGAYRIVASEISR
jgi:hypothetical protein